MEYRLNHTLELKCKIQKAWSLWQESNRIDQILSHYRDGTFLYGFAPFEFQEELFNEVIESAIDLPLPRLLKVDLCEIIHSMGTQIFKYIDLLIRDFYDSMENIEAICIENIFWTEDGIIDIPKSLRYLMENTEHTHPKNFYNLACTYCIDENLINELWWKIPEDFRNSQFYEREIYQHPCLHAIAYWKHYSEGTLLWFIEMFMESSTNHEAYILLFLYSTCYNTNETTKFFYNKIPEDERQKRLLHCGKILERTRYDGELKLFILSKMNEENRLRTIEQFSNTILKQLLHTWPWRELYVSVFDNISYLSKDAFLTIINDILESIKEAHKSYKLKIQLILSKIWNKNISKEYKKFVNFFQVFVALLEAGDVEHVVSIAMDKDLQNVPLTCLAFLIIRTKYPHLLEEYENLGIGKINREGITKESLKYCLSEFLKNKELEAPMEILFWYFENQPKELNICESNFP